MNQKNKIIFLSSVIIGVLTLTLGVTFAIFNFNKTSTNSKLIVGDIYMHYNETNQLVIDNAMPSDTYNSTNYFEFTVDGKNTTTNKDIWYEIVLSHGDNHATRTTRIKDNLLKFTLVEIKDAVETVVVDGKSYQDLTSRRIWVDTINKNTTTEVTHTYRLYMWISNNTIIGNVNQDYTMEEWNDVYASIKVNVTGDFNEKEVPIEATPESCFTYQEIEGGVEITNYDASCGVDVVIPNTINGLDVLSITAHQSEIEGSMISIGGFSNKNLTSVVLPSNLLTIKNGTFSGNRLTSVVIPDSVTTIGSHTFKNNQLTNIIIPDSVTTIGKHAFYGNQLTSVTIGNNVTTIGEAAFEYNQLTNLIIPNSVTTIRNRAFESNQLTSVTIPDSVTTIEFSVFENNKLTSVTIPDSVTTIERYAFANNQLTSVTIPNSVTTIGPSAFENNKLTSVTIPDSVTTIEYKAFKSNQLTSVKIPDSVTTIGREAFNSNQLTSVTIPDSVTTIGWAAFSRNQLTSVTIPNSVTTIESEAFRNNQLTSVNVGSGVQYIGRYAFYKDSSSNPNLSSITINRSCSDIKNIPASSTDSTEYYPWLSDSSHYTASGVTIYGTGGDVCDSY